MQYHLLEAATSQSVWNGTDMFNMAEVAAAIQRRRDQFLADTGVVLTNFLLNIVPPPSGRVTLPDSVIDVRRAAWLGSAPLDYYTHMWRDDEFALTAGDPTWSISPGTPNGYSVMAPPPIRMQLSPAPQDSGLLDMVTVNAGNALTPATIESLLGIPDNTAWIVKWGALADLLGRDGQGRDPVRAAYCEMRYRQGVELTRLLPVIVHAELNGVPSIPGSLASHDMGSPNWQNITGAPEEILVAGNNLIALANVPADVYSVTLDVVASRPTGLCVCPTSAGFLQLGREQVDMILDYAEHLALFKVGGAEFEATQRQAENFFLQSIAFNQRLSASARYIIKPKDYATAEEHRRPRRVKAQGLGTMPEGGAGA